MLGCPAHVKRACNTAAERKLIRTPPAMVFQGAWVRTPGYRRTPGYYGTNPGVPPSKAVNSAQTGRWAETAWSVNGFRS